MFIEIDYKGNLIVDGKEKLCHYRDRNCNTICDLFKLPEKKGEEIEIILCYERKLNCRSNMFVDKRRS